MSDPMVSIMMPCYNDERYIDAAIVSILSQDFSDFELVIVDDASTDNSLDIINEYAKVDTRIVVVANPSNLGVGLNRKVALKRLTGKYVAFCDSDDFWQKKKLSTFVAIAESGCQNVVLHSDSILIDENSNEIGQTFQGRFNTKNFPLAGNLRHYLYLTNYINLSASMLSRQALNDAGGFRQLYSLDDWDMWVRVASCCQFKYIEYPLSSYRLRHDSNSFPKDPVNINTSRVSVYRYIIENCIEDSMPSSLISQIYYLCAIANANIGDTRLSRMSLLKSIQNNPFHVKAIVKFVIGSVSWR